MEEALHIKKIKEGTVIDHITAGNALSVLKILGLTGSGNNIVSIAMNVPSQKLKKKDILKVEGRELNPDEVDRISLIAPKATINIVRNYKVVDKKVVKLPKVIKEIVKCINPACISNSNEPINHPTIIVKEIPIATYLACCLLGCSVVLK